MKLLLIPCDRCQGVFAIDNRLPDAWLICPYCGRFLGRKTNTGCVDVAPPLDGDPA